MANRIPFLTADWRYLAMLNYPVDLELLRQFVPRGVELDEFRGVTYVSMVGFLFLSTRVLGLPIPLHTNFEEVNLRFYVRRYEGAQAKRGVVFVREIVPRWAIARIARFAYNENYVPLPMSHRIDFQTSSTLPGFVEYGWRTGSRQNRLSVNVSGDPLPLVAGSEQQFIAEHYWGYAAQRDGSTMEYEVEHPPWRVWDAGTPQLDVDAERLYGPEFAQVLAHPPSSAFLAEGSAVTVYRPRRL